MCAPQCSIDSIERNTKCDNLKGHFNESNLKKKYSNISIYFAQTDFFENNFFLQRSSHLSISSWGEPIMCASVGWTTRKRQWRLHSLHFDMTVCAADDDDDFELFRNLWFGSVSPPPHIRMRAYAETKPQHSFHFFVCPHAARSTHVYSTESNLLVTKPINARIHRDTHEQRI